MTVNNGHKFPNIIIIDGNLHTLPSQYIRRTYKNRISQFIGSLQRLFCGKDSLSCRSRNSTLFQNFIKEFTIFGSINIFCTGSKNRNPHFQKCLCQLDGSLTTKLHNRTVRFFNIYNIFHVFRCQWFKVQFVRHIKIRADCFRIVIDDNCLITTLSQRPHAVHGTEIELDSLSDTDWAGAKNHNSFSGFLLFHFRLTAKYTIIIWRAGFEFRSTGIHHLKRSNNSVVQTHFTNFLFRNTHISGNYFVRELHAFCLCKNIRSQFFRFQSRLHLHKMSYFIDKPLVDFGNLVNLIIGCPFPNQFSNNKDSSVIHNFNTL